MGAGVLSSPFHPDWRLSTDSARVIGIDQSQLALLWGSTALTLYGQPHELLETDFFNIPSSDLQQDLDALVCNPPYTEGDAPPIGTKNGLTRNWRRPQDSKSVLGHRSMPTLYTTHTLSCRRAIVRPSSPLKASSATDTESHSNSSSSTTTQSKPSYNSTRRATVSSITPTRPLCSRS